MTAYRSGQLFVLGRRSPAGSLASLTVWFLALLLVGSPVRAAPPDGSLSSLGAIRELKVEPSKIALRGASRQQQLQITAVLEGGAVRDVTHAAQLSVNNPRLARLDRAPVFGLSDGDSYLDVQFGVNQLRVPLHVREFAAYPAVHFANDVVPVLSKLGCNSGGCHGKASGQNGFRLSVFGFDPEADYAALVKEGRGRRIFPASPAESLLIAKPSGHIPHGGGLRLEPGSSDYVLLLEWIQQGMPVGQLDAPSVTEVRASPTDRILGFGDQQQIITTAIYSDGSRRDVTAAAAYASNAPLVAGNQLQRDFPNIHPASTAVAVRHKTLSGRSQSVQRRRNAPSELPGCNLNPAPDLDMEFVQCSFFLNIHRAPFASMYSTILLSR